MTANEPSAIQCFRCCGDPPEGGCPKCQSTGRVYWAAGRAFPYTEQGKLFARAALIRDSRRTDQAASLNAQRPRPSWRARLAEALDVAERTVRRWEKDETSIPEGVPAELAKLCRAHSEKLAKIADQLEGKGR